LGESAKILLYSEGCNGKRERIHKNTERVGKWGRVDKKWTGNDGRKGMTEK